MTAPEALTAEIRRQLGSQDGWDMVFAAPGIGTAERVREAATRVDQALQGMGPGRRAVLVHPNGATTLPPAEVGANGPALISLPMSPVDLILSPGFDQMEAYRNVFQLCRLAGARACVVLGSDPATLAPEALRHLVQPVVGGNVDLVTPCYVRRRFEGLLRSAVVRPMVRALYGRRIQSPIAGDFALSARLVEQQLGPVPPGRGALPLWLASDALCAGFEVGQAHLGIPLPGLREPPDVSTVVAQVLGALFVEVERNAPCWQRVRGSRPVPTFGTAPPAPAEDPGTVDVSRMVETFRLGYRNLQDVWSAVLPPATMVELKRLAALDPGSFRLPDPVWARIVYDFALAHRMRTINRDHLLKAMTPLYLAWVASFANEVRTAAYGAVEYRLERLEAGYEAEKPYFVSRWRWPDRFQP